jgi:hypothetical protein
LRAQTVAQVSLLASLFLPSWDTWRTNREWT